TVRNTGNVMIDPSTLTKTSFDLQGEAADLALVDVPASPPCPPTIVVDTVSVSPSGSTIAPGQTRAYAATVRDVDGFILVGIPLSWTSSDPNICSVDENGLVTGVAPGGPVTITATADGVPGSAACTVVSPQPDVQAYAVSATLTGALYVSSTVRNTGNVMIDKVDVGLYLSPDNVITGSGNDELVGSRIINLFQPGATNTNTSVVSLAGISPGTYYVGIIANYNNALKVGPSTYAISQEVNPNDNSSYTSVNYEIGADLKVFSLAANFSGTNIIVSDTEQNAGGLSSGPFTVSYYFSSSPTPNPATDPLIGSRDIVDLAGGFSTDSASSTFTIPASVPEGSYYVCAISDSGGIVNEVDEGNNTKCTGGSYAIGPDLKAYSLVVTPSGTNLAVSDTQQNIGNQAAGPFDVSFYLSATTTPNPASDPLLGGRSISGLSGGSATDSSSSSLPVPPGVPTGNYYVCAISDSGSAVTETDETNNVKCTSGTYAIGSDLKVYSLVANLSGTNILVSDTEQNSGNAPAGPFDVSFYFSTTTTPNPATDPLIGSRSLSGLNGGFTNNSATTTFAISPSVAPGTYRVCAISDSGDAVSESNESNNTKCTSGTYKIGPDLKVYSITANKSGGNVIVSDTEQNAGNQPAGPFDVSFYLSLDTTLDGSDPFLGSRSLSGLNGNAFSSASNSFPIPPGASGSYYVFGVSDSGDAVTETLENNNTKRTGGKVTLP
ncbi:MAG TPA: CARDB domain-containing protein, partial [Nitrospiria bacterium]|nr:CARDB domain-containing protein [Nitrospiria bacterium]